MQETKKSKSRLLSSCTSSGDMLLGRASNLLQGWQKYVCYGVLVCKLQLPQGVAIVANLHNVAFQVSVLQYYTIFKTDFLSLLNTTFLRNCVFLLPSPYIHLSYGNEYNSGCYSYKHTPCNIELYNFSLFSLFTTNLRRKSSIFIGFRF